MTETALTTAIKHAQKQSQIQADNDDRYDDGYKAAMCAMSYYLISLLPQEREDIEKAYDNGFNKSWGDGTAVQIHEHEYIDRAGVPIEKEYFNINFSQYKP